MNLKEKFEKWQLKKIQKQYDKIIQKLKTKEKIKVVFLNCESSKWSYQSLYEIFSNDKRFEVQVLVSVYDISLNKKYSFLNYKKRAEENYNFFKSQRINVAYAFDFEKRKPINLKKFSPDIIFYDEPQSSAKLQSVEKTRNYALTMYCNYGSGICNSRSDLNKMCKKLFTFFADNSFLEKKLITNGYDKKQVYNAGHPKLDAYLKPINENNIKWRENKKRIIFAPHFSFDINTDLKFGTFNQNYDYFLNFAKNHPEYEFIFKPHSSLKREIIKRKLMTLKEMEQYFSEWENLANAQVYENGNYIDMFRTSDLLITDCNSFLLEYLLTKKPVLRLVNQNSVSFNEYGKEIIKGYYKACSIQEIDKYLKTILVLNKDPLLEQREKIIKQYMNADSIGAAQKIYNYIYKECQL